MKTFKSHFLHVLIRSSFSPYNNKIGVRLHHNDHFVAVVVGPGISIFFPAELTTLPDSSEIRNYGYHGKPMVSLCAWCADKNPVTEALLKDSGWIVSHTICPACREAFETNTQPHKPYVQSYP